MVRMVKVVGGVIVVAVVVALVAWALRRRGSDEVHSVDGYRHTLDTLQDIRTRSGSGTVRVLGGGAGSEAADRGAPSGGGLVAGGRPAEPGATGPGATGRELGSAPTRRSEPARRSEPTRGLVFDDHAAGDAPMAPPGTGRHGRDRAISAMNHRPRRLGVPILVGAVVLALLGLVVWIGAQSQHHGTPPAGGRSGSTSTSTSSGAGGGTAGTGHGTTTTTAPKSTTTTSTTLPKTYTPVTSTATTASYTPPSGTYTLTMAATTGNCWITATTAGGTSLLSQTLPAGQSKSVTTSGQVTIVVGAPSVVQVSVDHRPVVLPTGYQTPFTITLSPVT